MGCRGAWEETPDAGDTSGYRAGLWDGNPRDSRGQTEYLEWKRLCRPVLHNTRREGKPEEGGGNGRWEERGKLCFWLESTSLWAVAAVMGPGGRGEACKLIPCGETLLGGDAAAETFGSGKTPGGDFRLATRTGGVARCRLEEVRRARKTAGRSPLQTPRRPGDAGPRGVWLARSGGFAAEAQGEGGE